MKRAFQVSLAVTRKEWNEIKSSPVTFSLAATTRYMIKKFKVGE
jgi:hypothetical protein